MSPEEIFRAKIQGLREFGLSLPDAGRLLKLHDGDMLEAAAHHKAVGLCVNVRGDRGAWNKSYAEGFIVRHKVTSDYKIVPDHT